MEKIKDIHVRPNTQTISHSGGALNLDCSRYDCFDITLTADLDTLTISNPVIAEDYKIIFRQDTVVRTVTLPATILVKGDTVDQINQANEDTCIVFTGLSSTELLEIGKVDPGTILSKASQAEAEAGTEDTKYLTSSKAYLGWFSWIANKTISALNTTSKVIIGAINELFKGVPEVNNWYVNKNGNDTTGVGTRQSPYLTISKAVTEASANDLIHIGSGTYSETVAISKSLVLIGLTSDSTHVDSDLPVISTLNLANGIEKVSLIGLKVSSHSVTISTDTYSSVYVFNSNCSIASPSYSNSGSLGVTLNIYLDGCNVSGTVSTTSDGGSPLYIEQHRGEFSGATITGNTDLILYYMRVLGVLTFNSSGALWAEGSTIQTLAASTGNGSLVKTQVITDNHTGVGSGSIAYVNPATQVMFNAGASGMTATEANAAIIEAYQNSAGSTPTYNDKGVAAVVTTADGDSTGFTLTSTPSGYPETNVNGTQRDIGDAVKTKEGYYSRDGGTTALALNALQSGDTLYWNGSIAGFELDTNDIISVNYNI